MKVFLVIIIVLISLRAFCQNTKFENEDFKVEMSIERSLDSMTIDLTLMNKTNRSFFFEQRTPASVNWSISGNLLIVALGTDLKSFNELEFPVTQVKPRTVFKTVITSAYSKDNFNLELKINLYKTCENASSSILNTTIRSKSGDWVWGEYIFPFSLTSK